LPIPARDEERNLPACLNAALRQGDPVIEILVYDDHSTDGTRRVIDCYAGIDRRVRAIDPVALAPGWIGKNFACHQLANAATGDWLLFLDADARLADAAVERMLGEMARRRLTFLSCWPGLEMAGFWERALMPMLNFVVFSLFPAPLSPRLNEPSLALAHGACLMFERRKYFEIGGHAEVRDQIFEDTRLAQLWRRRNARGLCLDGQEIVRVRMYASFGEIWRGFQKNFFPAFRREISFWLFLALHAVVFLSPFLLLPVAPWAALAILLIRFALALRFRHPLVTVLLHPLAEVILIAIGLSSWRRCKSGRGVAWKGREYHPGN
jgi:chlorobactene glucosyltransferase